MLWAYMDIHGYNTAIHGLIIAIYGYTWSSYCHLCKGAAEKRGGRRAETQTARRTRGVNPNPSGCTIHPFPLVLMRQWSDNGGPFLFGMAHFS